MEKFSKVQIETNAINKEVELSYKWSTGIYKSSMYDTELLIKLKVFKDGLISFDPKYGMNEHLEFNFTPIFIAHPNPPAQVNPQNIIN